MKRSHAFVKLYMMTECSFCRSAQTFFDERKIRYTTVDISRDQQARDEMVKKSGQPGVPVIVIAEKVFIGFNREAIERELSSELSFLI